MSQPYNFGGVQDLGAVLAGPTDTGAFADQLTRNNHATRSGYDAERAREMAAIAQYERMIAAGRQGAHAKIADPALFQGIGHSPAAATVLSAFGAADRSPSLADVSPYLDPAYLPSRAAAAEAMQAGDIPAYNRANAMSEGKNFEPLRIEDGYVIPSGADDIADVLPAPLTSARIRTEGARVGTEAARAEKALRPTAAEIKARQEGAPSAAEARPELAINAAPVSPPSENDPYAKAFGMTDSLGGLLPVAPIGGHVPGSGVPEPIGGAKPGPQEFELLAAGAPKGAVPAGRAKDGRIVYRLPNGELVTLD